MWTVPKFDFKVSEHSLFAYLLRAPWPVSLGLAALVGGGVHRVLPPQYAFFSILFALPFVVAALLVLKRGWGAPSSAQIEKIEKALATLSWTEFSALLIEAFERQGFAVSSGEKGVDFVLYKRGQRTLVSAKRWKAMQHGTATLEALFQRRDPEGAHALMYLALSGMSMQGEAYAQTKKIEVLGAPALARLLKGLPVRSAKGG